MSLSSPTVFFNRFTPPAEDDALALAEPIPAPLLTGAGAAA